MQVERSFEANEDGEYGYTVNDMYKNGSGLFKLVYRPKGIKVTTKGAAGWWDVNPEPVYVVGYEIYSDYNSGYATYTFPATEQGLKQAERKLAELCGG